MLENTNPVKKILLENRERGGPRINPFLICEIPPGVLSDKITDIQGIAELLALITKIKYPDAYLINLACWQQLPLSALSTKQEIQLANPIIIQGEFDEITIEAVVKKGGVAGIMVTNNDLDQFMLQYFYEICADYGKILFKRISSPQDMDVLIETQVECVIIPSKSLLEVNKILAYMPRRVFVFCMEGTTFWQWRIKEKVDGVICQIKRKEMSE